MVIDGYYINGYWCLLIVIILVAMVAMVAIILIFIGEYFINGY
jgi:hypothetical protein